MRNILKSAAVATLLSGLIVLFGAIVLARPAFAQAAPVPAASVEAPQDSEVVEADGFFHGFKSSNPSPTPGAVVLFGLGSMLVFTAQRKFAKA